MIVYIAREQGDRNCGEGDEIYGVWTSYEAAFRQVRELYFKRFPRSRFNKTEESIQFYVELFYAIEEWEVDKEV